MQSTWHWLSCADGVKSMARRRDLCGQIMPMFVPFPLQVLKRSLKEVQHARFWMMTMTSNVTFFKQAKLLAFLLIVCIAPDAISGPGSVPFKAKINTKEILVSGAEAGLPCPLAGMAVGIGQASHFGNILLAATDCIQPFPTYFEFSQGRFTLTAANGDTIKATYGGSMVATQHESNYKLNGWFQITGGSGRFAGARGTGQLRGTQQIINNAPPGLPSAAGELEMTGTISY